MHWIHWLVTLFFSGTAVSLLSYQATFLQYHIVKQWLLNEEEKTMEQTVAEIETYYAEKRNISWERCSPPPFVSGKTE